PICRCGAFLRGQLSLSSRWSSRPTRNQQPAGWTLQRNSRPRALQFKHAHQMNIQSRVNREPRIVGNGNGRPLEARKPVSLPRDKATITRINQWYDRRMFDSSTRDSGDFSNYG